MRRETGEPRPDLFDKVERLGFTFHTLNGQPYWTESAAYVLDASEIAVLESATNELHEMCLVAAGHLIEGGFLDRLGIPTAARSAITQAWEEDPPFIYGRFDLRFDGAGPPKLLEYNADTPTSLLEAAVVQWHWLLEAHPEADQFNSIWEALVEKWSDLKRSGRLGGEVVHFACQDEMEDVMTTAVMMDTAHEAGLDVRMMKMREIGWDMDSKRFVDTENQPIWSLFKLYPWEWMLVDRFGRHMLETYGDVQWIEPIWKMTLSNKGILAVLWELYPGHPNLLPAYLDGPRDLSEYVRKPLLGREGANVSIFAADGERHVGGPYGEAGYLYQAYAPLPVFDGNHVVIGSWVIDGAAHGIGIRESDGPITEDNARFVPHYFLSPVLF
jgi:glutathionylspermidine synthase